MVQVGEPMARLTPSPCIIQLCWCPKAGTGRDLARSQPWRRMARWGAVEGKAGARDRLSVLLAKLR
jgi:hypothetical protein